jgi:hypothetical protein
LRAHWLLCGRRPEHTPVCCDGGAETGCTTTPLLGNACLPLAACAPPPALGRDDEKSRIRLSSRSCLPAQRQQAAASQLGLRASASSWKLGPGARVARGGWGGARGGVRSWVRFPLVICSREATGGERPERPLVMPMPLNVLETSHVPPRTPHSTHTATHRRSTCMPGHLTPPAINRPKPVTCDQTRSIMSSVWWSDRWRQKLSLGKN